MSVDQSTLFREYCHECHDRMQRAHAAYRDYLNGRPTIDCFDRLHQEFDSLCGASRAVNMNELERFNRTMASYSRYLRNKYSSGVNEAELSLLEKGVDFASSCGQAAGNCLLLRQQQADELIEQITDTMDLAHHSA